MELVFVDHESSHELYLGSLDDWPTTPPVKGDIFKRSNRSYIVRGRTFNIPEDRLEIRLELLDD